MIGAEVDTQGGVTEVGVGVEVEVEVMIEEGEEGGVGPEVGVEAG